MVSSMSVGGFLVYRYMKSPEFERNLNCWHGKTELIWGGDHSIDEDFHPVLGEEYSMVTNLSCPKCNSYVEVCLPRDAYD